MTISKTAKQNTHDTHQLQMFVLDVLRHDDAEQLTSIIRLLNDDTCIGWRAFWPDDFSAAEVAPTLIKSMSGGLVEPLKECTTSGCLEPVATDGVDIMAQQDELWFRLTSQGRQAWNEWEPPTE